MELWAVWFVTLKFQVRVTNYLPQKIVKNNKVEKNKKNKNKKGMMNGRMEENPGKDEVKIMREF